ncbi:hypothetical protein [Aneurinibacillus tyrosinisolvens]|uniref:hypothetical protein n=1 Tax=Aneurinibacillus tyrosinisolvens TaxID=1443435 RepID=UPI00063F360C|nr:hypothetical protein [Aneurinibacillus tyrosinisolvens]
MSNYQSGAPSGTPTPENQEGNKIDFSGMFIPIATIVAYLINYLFDKGYWKYHQLPDFLWEFSPSALIAHSVNGFLISLGIILLVSLFTKKFITKPSNSWISEYILFVGWTELALLILDYFFGIVTSTNSLWRLGFFIGAMMLVPVVLTVVYRSKSWTSSFHTVVRSFTKYNSLIVAFTIIGPFSYMMGNIYAQSQQTYHVIEEKKVQAEQNVETTEVIENGKKKVTPKTTTKALLKDDTINGKLEASDFSGEYHQAEIKVVLGRYGDSFIVVPVTTMIKNDPGTGELSLDKNNKVDLKTPCGIMQRKFELIGKDSPYTLKQVVFDKITYQK